MYIKENFHRKKYITPIAEKVIIDGKDDLLDMEFGGGGSKNDEVDTKHVTGSFETDTDWFSDTDNQSTSSEVSGW